MIDVFSYDIHVDGILLYAQQEPLLRCCWASSTRYSHLYTCITMSYHLLCSVIPEVLSRSDNSKYNTFKQLSLEL